jgi:hypothetical protein
MLRLNNFQCHPPLVLFISRKPNGGKPAGTEFVHNFIAPTIEHVAKVNRMEAAGFISLYIFCIADTLGEEEARIIILFKIRTGRHVGKG